MNRWVYRKLCKFFKVGSYADVQTKKESMTTIPFERNNLQSQERETKEQSKKVVFEK